MTTQTDPANVRTLVHDASGVEVESFFGCILDVNQSAQAVFPLHPSSDGPFGGALQSVLSLIRNAHQCLVAEIAFDPDVIGSGSTPGSSDKLAQRNLSLIASDNPGEAASRRIPNTFEVRPTPAAHAAAGFHDELMIDWGNVPDGSVARIYLPDTAPDEVLDLAKRLYRAGRLERIDGHTLRCRAGGITYVPVPAGAQINHAGLLTIDLPAGVKRGQSFHAVVRQLTHVGRATKKQGAGGPDVAEHVALTTAAAAGRLIVWEHVLGAFQVTIPISSRALLLDDEVRLLSCCGGSSTRSRRRTAGISRSRVTCRRSASASAGSAAIPARSSPIRTAFPADSSPAAACRAAPAGGSSPAR